MIQIDDRFTTQWRVTSSFKFAPEILSTSIVFDPANATQIDVGFCDINRTLTQATSESQVLRSPRSPVALFYSGSTSWSLPLAVGVPQKKTIVMIHKVRSLPKENMINQTKRRQLATGSYPHINTLPGPKLPSFF